MPLPEQHPGPQGGRGSLGRRKAESTAKNGRTSEMGGFAGVAPGSCPPGAPTDPDMHDSRIRLLWSALRCQTVQRVDGPGRWQRVPREQCREAVPRQPCSPRPPPQPLAPSSHLTGRPFPALAGAEERARLRRLAVRRGATPCVLWRHPDLPGSWRTLLRSCPALGPRRGGQLQAPRRSRVAFRLYHGVGPRPRTFGAPSRGLHSPCVRFAAGITPGPRNTRFRLVASLDRAGLATRRVLPKGFRVMVLHPLPLSQASPGAR